MPNARTAAKSSTCSAKAYGLEVLGRIPFRPAITAAGDVGSIELCDDTPLKEAADKIEALIPEEDR